MSARYKLGSHGYKGAIKQATEGMGINWLAEFVPAIKRILHIEKRNATGHSNSDMVEHGSSVRASSP
jgi:hypothetical protein